MIVYGIVAKNCNETTGNPLMLPSLKLTTEQITAFEEDCAKQKDDALTRCTARKNVALGARAFCNSTGSTLGITIVSELWAIAAIVFATMNSGCACAECFNGKKQQNFIYAVFSGAGGLLALINWAIFLALNTAWNSYANGIITTFNLITQQTTVEKKDVLLDTAGGTFDTVLIMALIWGFFVIVGRGIQGALSFQASREDWKEKTGDAVKNVVPDA